MRRSGRTDHLNGAQGAPYEGKGHGKCTTEQNERDSRQRAESLRNNARRTAGTLPDAGHEPVEFAPARFSADRRNGRGALPVLRSAVRTQANQIMDFHILPLSLVNGASFTRDGERVGRSPRNPAFHIRHDPLPLRERDGEFVGWASPTTSSSARRPYFSRESKVRRVCSTHRTTAGAWNAPCMTNSSSLSPLAGWGEGVKCGQ